jgi:hypothetical protein
VILRSSTVAYGPGEPEWVYLARLAYYERRVWVEALENRLCKTYGGMTFVYRVKAIGRSKRT